MLNLLITTLSILKNIAPYEQIDADFSTLINTPIKAIKKYSQNTKDYNTLLSKTRIKMEYIVAKFKTSKVFSITYLKSSKRFFLGLNWSLGGLGGFIGRLLNSYK